MLEMFRLKKIKNLFKKNETGHVIENKKSNKETPFYSVIIIVDHIFHLFTIYSL